jgi:hypothetical protein
VSVGGLEKAYLNSSVGRLGRAAVLRLLHQRQYKFAVFKKKNSA